MVIDYKMIVELVGLGIALGALIYKLGRIHAGVELLVTRFDKYTEKIERDIKELQNEVDNLSVDLAVFRARNA